MLLELFAMLALAVEYLYYPGIDILTLSSLRRLVTDSHDYAVLTRHRHRGFQCRRYLYYIS